jgi:Leucine-rich repeat (LRR) protein
MNLHNINCFETFAELRTLNMLQINFDVDDSELSALSKLERLALGNCTGIEDFAHIAQLTNLRILIFYQKDTTMNTSSVSLLTNLSKLLLGVRKNGEVLDLNLSHLAGLTKLTSIDMTDSRVEGNVESLSQLKDLKALSFHVGVTTGDLSVLTNFTNLQKLSLYNNSTESAMSPLRGNIQVLTHLIRLKVLVFSGFNLQGDIAALSQCSGLERLNLSALPQLQGDISVLSTLTKLSDCALGVLPSINGDISVFSNIETLTIKDCVGLTGNKTALTPILPTTP